MAPCVSTALIVGGGIAGLSVSIALSRVGVRCTVLERGNPNEGASIAFSGRAAEALVELGIYDILAENGTLFPHDTTAAAMRDTKGNLVSPGPARPQWPGARQAVAVYRPTMITLMAKTAKELGVTILQETTFTKIDNVVSGVVATLTDGQRQTYDVVVGADGLESSTRKALFDDWQNPPLTYTGQISVR